MPLKKSELYSSLWASCDELRGGMDASQYKDYVLFMLFIKYITDKYGNSKDFAPPVTIPKGASFKDMLDLRGKSDDEIIALMVKGIQEVDSNKKFTIIKKEEEAIRHAIGTAPKGSFITLCSDVVPDALALVLKLKEQDEKVDFNKSDIPNRNKELVG